VYLCKETEKQVVNMCLHVKLCRASDSIVQSESELMSYHQLFYYVHTDIIVTPAQVHCIGDR